MSKPKVSIIIPVYNREKCILACVESILKTEYPLWEIIIIDDGSTDSLLSIIRNVSFNDSRIKYYHQENAGVSAARNYGLSVCNGEWVTFVDSDDAILPSHLNIFNSAKSDGVDLLMTDYTSGFYEKRKIITRSKNNICTEIITAPLGGNYLFCDYNPFKNLIFPVWNKFFKMEIIKSRNLKFDQTMSLGEDQVFLCNYLLYAKGICHFKQCTYVNLHWDNIIHLGSILRTPSNFMYNIKRNYESLCTLIPIYGNCVEKYAVNYGLDRPITRILYNYTKRKNSGLLAKGELRKFVESDIIPFISLIDISQYTARSANVRFVRMILLKMGAGVAIKYCYIYNVINSLLTSLVFLARRVYKIIKW